MIVMPLIFRPIVLHIRKAVSSKTGMVKEAHAGKNGTGNYGTNGKVGKNSTCSILGFGMGGLGWRFEFGVGGLAKLKSV